MKSINAAAMKTFAKLTDGLTTPGQARRIDTAPGAFMAVSVDRLMTLGNGYAVFAIAHRYEQNGDLVPDPDVEFLAAYVDGQLFGVYPLAIDQAVGYRRCVELNADGAPERWNPRGQADLATFCNVWMRNIRAQQEIA